MKKAQVIWSVFVIAVTAAIGLSIWHHLSTYRANDHQVVLARNAQWRLHELAIELQTAENAVRGFLLTNRAEFAGRYRASRAKIDERIALARQVVPGVELDDDFREVRPLIDERLAMLGQMMELAQSGKRGEATAVLDSETGLANLAMIRERGFELIRKTDERLVQRLEICRRSMFAMICWVLIGVAALVLSCAALVWLLWRDLRRQIRISAELETARDAALAGTRARDEFLNVLSHELRTPLTPALASVGLLERKSESGSEIRGELTMVRRQLELEARLIDDLLNVEQVLRGKLVLNLRQTSIHTLLNQAVDTSHEQLEQGNLTLTRKLDATHDLVRGDDARLYLIIWHVMSNAIKFTPPGGSILVQTTDADGSIAVKITDTGVGMTDQQLRSIFQPFRQVDSSLTRRFGGLGIGLAISKHIAELHGGSLGASSSGLGKGATFTLTLPIVSAARPNESLQRRSQPLGDMR
jgi:signal transduction histidine kinase